MNHDDPQHVYSPSNPSGCDKFYCLRRFKVKRHGWTWYRCSCQVLIRSRWASFAHWLRWGNHSD